MCNGFSMMSLRCSDRLNGTDYEGKILASIRHGLRREYIPYGDGHILIGRNRHTGLAARFAVIKIVENCLSMIPLHATMPEEVERTWELMRTYLLWTGADGRARVRLPGRTLDLGNNSFSALLSLAMLKVCAGELGDQEMLEALDRTVAEGYPMTLERGVCRYSEGSQAAHVFMAIAEVLRPGGLYDLVNHGMHEAHRDGPILATAAYPDVLVARAVAKKGALDLILYPGRSNGQYGLGLCGMIPGRRYRVCGSWIGVVDAGPAGEARLDVPLRGRTELRIAPDAATA